jgi:hypothetical protein
MTRTKLCIGVFLASLLPLGGCAKSPQKTGFLSNYSNLEPVSSTSMRYIAPDNALGKYSSFIVDPVTTHLYDEKEAAKIADKDVQHLQQYMYEAVRKALGTRYQLVHEPGPGVARLRIAITNLKASSPVLNAIPQTKMSGIGLGQASAEAELVDSQTGAQLAAAIESSQGSRLSLSGLSKWGDVEAVMNDWAKRLAKRIDEAHGVQAAAGVK